MAKNKKKFIEYMPIGKPMHNEFMHSEISNDACIHRKEKNLVGTIWNERQVLIM